MILYTDDEIKKILKEGHPDYGGFIEENFDKIKKEMMAHSYFIDKINDTIRDVGLEIIMEIKK